MSMSEVTVQTHLSIKLDGSVDSRGEAIIPPDIILPTAENTTIAPWLAPDDEPPTPPPKPSRSFGFPHKPSFTTFRRQPSATNLLAPRGNRPSDSRSMISVSDSVSSSTHSGEYAQPLAGGTPYGDMRKAKSSMSMISLILKKSRSKNRLRVDSEAEHPSLRQSAPPLPDSSFASLLLAGPSPSSSPPKSTIKKDKKAGKRKATNLSPPPPPRISLEPEFRLDTNLYEMEGIIDPTILSSSSVGHEATSPGSGFDSSSMGHSHSDHSSQHGAASMTSPNFSNPFLPTSASPKRLPYALADYRKVSPKTIVPPVGMVPPTPEGVTDPAWTAPESWAVEKEGEDPGEPEYSSSEDSLINGPGGRATSISVNWNGRGSNTSSMSAIPPTVSTSSKRKSRRKTALKSQRQPSVDKTFKIRIYRANNSYHVVSIGLHVTVANLTPALNQRLLPTLERETHRLYLKERGRERVLAQTERPADIVRRRLEQAGYDVADGLEVLGEEDLTFLLKFVYKSQLLGPADEELMFDNFELIDLTGRSLHTIPIILHTHADAIVSLKLSRNPMLEIPLDFIQSCVTLRELRLSNMAMKKVPHSVRHSVTLHRLDLSCNRIADLDEAGLDRIPGLMTIFIQNNRMEKLPWYFPRLRCLVTLNISNNKFRHLPPVVGEMVHLRDLDISFNMISELPEELGKLTALERLVIVGNSVSKIPDECGNLASLRLLDCRRNQISDLAVVCMLPKLEKLSADHNAVHALDLSLGPNLTTLDASHNEITQLSLIPGPIGRSPYTLVSLDISHAKLSTLDGLALAQLSSLQMLRLDHNSFRFIPDSLGELSWLETLSCSDNQLDALPASIGRLQKLETLDAHNNSLTELPVSLWNCASLSKINVTSNLLGIWHDPPVVMSPADVVLSVRGMQPLPERKPSASSIGGRPLPPLAHSLEKLYLGENRLTDEVLHPLTILRELRVLNLSFNEIQDMMPTFFQNLTKLEELYMSGNKLTSIPTEDLPKLTRLSVLFLNGNRLQTLPQELGKVQSLTVLDVGSNLLKYNINNWEFDWNWNFNKNLKYLNLSGNKRLQIKSDVAKVQGTRERQSLDRTTNCRPSLAGFTNLTQLRVLGLMDVTITTTGMNTNIDIPDENEDRRVRTSLSTVNGMPYGIADALGKNEHLNMLDLVHEFRGNRKGEAIFAMFGRAQPPKQLASATGSNRLAKFLHDRFLTVFIAQLNAIDPHRNESVPDALRRSFLKLNKELHDMLYSVSSTRKMSQSSASVNGVSNDPSIIRSGASGIVLYFVGRTMYVANVGNTLAVVSRQGTAEAVSRKHDPFDRSETARIRAAEGWVSPPGLVNDEIDISRSFGFYHLLPIVNARPDICTWELSELDEFVIVGNRGLWNYVSYQTAVDIARSERADPMIAAQKLRDFAISYGAEGSTMIMVIGVAELFNTGPSRSRQPTLDSILDAQGYASHNKRRRRDDITDRNISRLDLEVSPPIGHVCLVFTDIRNSTHLWEANPGMPTAMRLHNNLLRRQLRFCGGYEVKTEGDAFMCSFPTTLSALWWCLTVQVQLLHESWPLEILECEDGKAIYDAQDRLVARGLSVRMGIHCGIPLCEPDPITHRMDYFGPMVNRSSRISGSASGGQIMCSADVIREINAKIFETEAETEYSDFQPSQAIDAIRRLGVVIVPVGEVKLKGLEVPEMLSLVYPTCLEGRKDLEEAPADPNSSGSRVQFSVLQMRELGILCLRLEALASSRVFRAIPERKGSIQTLSLENESVQQSAVEYMYCDPNILLTPMNDKASDADLMMLLDSLSVRIENALATMTQKYSPSAPNDGALISALKDSGGLDGLDERTLQQVFAALQNI